MKYLILTLSVLFTLFVFSMSFQSGIVSSELSGSISQTIYTAIIEPITFLQLSFEAFHTIIRKLAHITEYFILGGLWVSTFHSFKWKLGYALILGLVIASLDETIQIFSIDRGPSIVDILLFDYVGYFIGGFISIRIFHYSIH